MSVRNLDALDRADPYDVCVIGSGPAGSTLSTALAAAGLRTLLLESGAGLLQWMTDRRLRSLAKIEFSGDTRYPLTETKARALGGNSNFWTGRCERFHPADFEGNPYEPPGNPWPIGYADLDPYYERAEETLRVRGGPRSRSAPPRRRPFPLPPRPDITPLRGLVEPAGMELDDSPTATPRRDIRFFRTQREILPAFLASERAALVTGMTVTRLETDADGRVTGAEVRSLDGAMKRARARLFVVACGGMESPRLLLLSRSEAYPNGIGNAHDRVGRGFNEHPSVNFYARVPHTWGTLAPTNKVGRTHQFYTAFREEGLGSVLPVVRQSWILINHNLPMRRVFLPQNAASVLARFARAILYMGVVTEMRIEDANRVTLSEREVDRFGNPLAHLIFNFGRDDLELLERGRSLVRNALQKVRASQVREDEVTWCRHHQGTCRMGRDPKTSVVDPNLRVHGHPNLYVCGSEVFVTGGSMQPCLTIVALAHRLADHIKTTMERG